MHIGWGAVLAIYCACFSSLALAADEPVTAQLTVAATVGQSACNLRPGDEAIVLQMDASLQTLRTQGKMPAVPFDLHLEGCTDVASRVHLRFSGQGATGQPNWLALDPASEASGVAIALSLAGEPIALNGVAPPQRLYGGENILHCAASLTRLTAEEVQAGAFSATTTFELHYD
ncbi:fimbrial protein [Aeromonas hydrophila]|uniref:fimbrial protein n=1 Tax=Aeromonas hydrophila TaxID=644 RepID=UPI002ECFBFA4|nr:fimbrial protein [Aeromonas hydrophila]